MTEPNYKVCPQCQKRFTAADLRAPHNFKRQKLCSLACMDAAKRFTPEEGARAFWAKVDKSAGPDGCWLYMGFRKWDGYGWLARAIDGRATKYMTAHRYAWILTKGMPAEGLHICHRCDNPPCCNPAHLFIGTHDDNMADKRDKGRAAGNRVLHPNRVRPARKETA